ncbi:MAG: hypothetical protein HY646_04150, partial [Acidobacteria bacterium]|nr:hypothetical protein [Acidobacteriota bacterium]
MSAFEFFFKYKPVVYEKGRLAFQLLSSPWLFVIFVIAAAAGAYFVYRNVARDKYSVGMVALRAATFTLLAFLFLRPVLNISTVLPQESYLAVVIDNSESMNIRDDGTTSRAEDLKAHLESTDVLKRLSEKFRMRVYRFDREAQRIERPDQMTYDGKRTRLEAATNLL